LPSNQGAQLDLTQNPPALAINAGFPVTLTVSEAGFGGTFAATSSNSNNVAVSLVAFGAFTVTGESGGTSATVDVSDGTHVTAITVSVGSVGFTIH
jgi:hypothetical protein